MICKTCLKEVDALCSDECFPCREKTEAAWSKKMAIRQDPAQFDLDTLIRLMLTQHWMHMCEIIPKYMPPFPDKNTIPRCVIKYTYPDDTYTFLRYSRGPLQGYFWDAYGEDMLCPELALLALMNAPAPVRVGTVIPTHGK